MNLFIFPVIGQLDKHNMAAGGLVHVCNLKYKIEQCYFALHLVCGMRTDAIYRPNWVI